MQHQVQVVEHGTHDHPHVALDEKAFPPVLRLDHDVVVRKGDEPDRHSSQCHQCGKEGPSKQSQGQVKGIALDQFFNLEI